MNPNIENTNSTLIKTLVSQVEIRDIRIKDLQQNKNKYRNIILLISLLFIISLIGNILLLIY